MCRWLGYFEGPHDQVHRDIQVQRDTQLYGNCVEFTKVVKSTGTQTRVHENTGTVSLLRKC